MCIYIYSIYSGPFGIQAPDRHSHRISEVSAVAAGLGSYGIGNYKAHEVQAEYVSFMYCRARNN